MSGDAQVTILSDQCVVLSVFMYIFFIVSTDLEPRDAKKSAELC